MESKLVGTTRMYLALVLVVLVAVMAVVAVLVPDAMVVFDKLNPILMLILGYYFGRNK